MKQEPQYDKAIRGEWFIQGDPQLKAERDRAKVLCWELNQISPADEQKRQELLRQLIDRRHVIVDQFGAINLGLGGSIHSLPQFFICLIK